MILDVDYYCSEESLQHSRHPPSHAEVTYRSAAETKSHNEIAIMQRFLTFQWFIFPAWLLCLCEIRSSLGFTGPMTPIGLQPSPSTKPLTSSNLKPLRHHQIAEHLAMELAVAGVLGAFTDPVVESIFNATHIKHQSLSEVPFQDTLLFGAADSISTTARVFVFLLLGDLACDALGVTLPFEADLGESAPVLALGLWAALTLSAVKKTIFLQGISGTQLGRVALYDQLLDVLIGIVAVAVVVDVLKIDVGMGLQSVLAGSGIGALLFSLASKDLAQALVGGFIVQAWDAFDVGEEIRLGDGTEGTVKKIGLVETEIVDADNISIKIPNSQLTNTRVSNLSRIERSRVFQTLRFNYSDLPKLPKVLEDIKSEIRSSCPKLITDGSKPFSVILNDYEADHIEAIVNCHFAIPPSSGDYAQNRQEVLFAISRALNKNNVSFALPSIVYQSNQQTIFAKNDDLA
jgi:small-conductance mechanosensitive channel